jgi:hypothetical protein
MRRISAFNVGWLLCMVGGLIPFTVGSVNYFFFMRSLEDPHDYWQTPFGPLYFSLQEVRRFRVDLGATWTMLNQVAWANVVMTGITMMVASWIGIRNRERWGWFMVLLAIAWVGANDLTATMRVGRELGDTVALPVAPMCFALPGLALTAREVFSSRSKTK